MNENKDVKIFTSKLEKFAAAYMCTLDEIVYAKCVDFDEHLDYVFEKLPFDRADYSKNKREYIVSAERLEVFCSKYGIHQDFLEGKDSKLFTDAGLMRTTLMQMGMDEQSPLHNIVKGFLSLPKEMQTMIIIFLKTWKNSIDMNKIGFDRIKSQTETLAKYADIAIALKNCK